MSQSISEIDQVFLYMSSSGLICVVYVSLLHVNNGLYVGYLIMWEKVKGESHWCIYNGTSACDSQ